MFCLIIISEIMSVISCFSWIQGFQGSKVEYITRDTVCFKCGNFVRFLGDDGHGSVFSPGEGVSCIAAHSINKVFAVAEQTLNPRIYVMAYPSFRQVAELKGLFVIIFNLLLK